MSLISHAPTQAVRNAAFPADEALDPPGVAAALAFAGKVRRVDRALSSPCRGAVQTAAALGLDARIEPALGEIDYGLWTGRTLSEVERDDKAGLAAWLSDTSAAPHGGEPVDALLARVRGWLAAVEGERVVAVTHASVLRAAIVAALEAPSGSFWRIDVPPLCRVRLRGGSGRWTLLSLSR